MVLSKQQAAVVEARLGFAQHLGQAGLVEVQGDDGRRVEAGQLRVLLAVEVEGLGDGVGVMDEGRRAVRRTAGGGMVEGEGVVDLGGEVPALGEGGTHCGVVVAEDAHLGLLPGAVLCPRGGDHFGVVFGGDHHHRQPADVVEQARDEQLVGPAPELPGEGTRGHRDAEPVAPEELLAEARAAPRRQPADHRRGEHQRAHRRETEHDDRVADRADLGLQAVEGRVGHPQHPCGDGLVLGDAAGQGVHLGVIAGQAAEQFRRHDGHRRQLVEPGRHFGKGGVGHRKCSCRKASTACSSAWASGASAQ